MANRTGETIRIQSGGKEFTALPGDAASFPYRQGPVAVDIGGVTTRYDIPGFEMEYLKTGFFGATLRCELYADKRVYMIKPNDAYPTDPRAYPQPAGFPLSPGAANAQ